MNEGKENEAEAEAVMGEEEEKEEEKKKIKLTTDKAAGVTYRLGKHPWRQPADENSYYTIV